jgi:hypothetical protein
MSDIDELDSDVSSVFGEVLQSNWYNTGTESLSDNGAIYCRDLEQYAFQNQLVLDKRFYQPSGKVLVVVSSNKDAQDVTYLNASSSSTGRTQIIQRQ